VLRPLAAMVVEDNLVTAVDAVVPLKDYRRAVQRAMEGGRSGKVVIDLAAAD